jgi:hypothetical protein
MPFGFFVMLSLLYAVVGIRVLGDIVRHRRTMFDEVFTESDRYLVGQAAFFLLVPLSVALHELGHAIAIWSFGGRVTDFGFYVFAGFVSYNEPFTDTQRIIVALAGPLVNVVLAGAALAAIVLRRPPMRAAFNEMLFQFAVISTANALIFYPLLDFGTGMEGDWSQIYDGGKPLLSGLILAAHLGILFGAYAAWRNDRVRGYLARLTGVPPGGSRRLFGAARQPRPARSGTSPSVGETLEAKRLRNAATRVASGWPAPVGIRIEHLANSEVLTMQWSDGIALRAISVQSDSNGNTRLVGAMQTTAETRQKVAELGRWMALPDEDDLVVRLRIGMEQVEAWPGATMPASTPDGF